LPHQHNSRDTNNIPATNERKDQVQVEAGRQKSQKSDMKIQYEDDDSLLLGFHLSLVRRMVSKGKKCFKNHHWMLFSVSFGPLKLFYKNEIKINTFIFKNCQFLIFHILQG